MLADGGDLPDGLAELQKKWPPSDRRPLIIFGLTSSERLARHPRIGVLAIPSFCYLQLPAYLKDIMGRLRQAKQTAVSFQAMMEKEWVPHVAFQKIRKFKHDCDNVWMALKTRAGLAREALSNNSEGGQAPPEVFPPQISAGILDLADEYHQIETFARRLRVLQIDRVEGLLSEVKYIINNYSRECPLSETLDLAESLVVKISEVAAILGKAKEWRGE